MFLEAEMLRASGAFCRCDYSSASDYPTYRHCRSTYPSSTTMVINPTYLAQRTRTCKLTRYNFRDVCANRRSNKLDGCEAEGDQGLQGMAKIRSWLHLEL